MTAQFDFATDDEVESALAAGATAFRTWRELSIEERAALATKVGALFAERADELARYAVEEMGKPLSEAIEEVEFCQSIFGYYGEQGPGLAADQPITTFSGGRAVVQKRPVGPLLGVMPWNFPYYQVARFAAPNLVLGNTIVLKHAESVPALAPQRSSSSSTMPASRPASTQNVFATHAQVETIIADPRVQGVSLTGSERAGVHHRRARRQAPQEVRARARRLRPVRRSRHRRRRRSGRTGMGDPAVQHRPGVQLQQAHDRDGGPLRAVRRRAGRLASGLRPGDPTNPSKAPSRRCPRAPRSSRSRRSVDDAVAQGATLHAGGELPTEPRRTTRQLCSPA